MSGYRLIPAAEARIEDALDDPLATYAGHDIGRGHVGSVGGPSWLVIAVPTDAAITRPIASHCTVVSDSCRNRNPLKAPTAGSRL